MERGRRHTLLCVSASVFFFCGGGGGEESTQELRARQNVSTFRLDRCYVVLGERFYIYSINEVLIQTQKCLNFFPTSEKTSCSQWKIRPPEDSFKLKRWQGPPQGKTV